MVLVCMKVGCNEIVGDWKRIRMEIFVLEVFCRYWFFFIFKLMVFDRIFRLYYFFDGFIEDLF